VQPFAVGTVFVLGLAAVVSAAVSVIPGMGGLKHTPKKVYKGSRSSRFMWSFMRISGVIIIPLVFGHLAMMHVIQGVFDITKTGHVPVGALTANFVTDLPAVNFVRLRWDTMVAGVFIWRIYDVLLLVLVVIHGFNGARYVNEDYVKNPVVRRTISLALLGTMIAMLLLGTLAIIQTVPASTDKLLHQTSQIVGK